MSAPTGGGTYQPQGSLSSFIGEIAAGTWTLTISDSFNQDGGSLETWGINICYGACLAAEAPVVESSGDNVCPGDLVTLSVSSGNLNDASDWYWFSDECDGDQLGTGSSIDVNPQENTTYYVRGVDHVAEKLHLS